MAAIKTAISIEEPLFEQAEAAAREMNISRSRLYALALEEYLRRRETRRLMESIDAAYADGPDPEEQALLRAMRRSHQQRLKAEAESW